MSHMQKRFDLRLSPPDYRPRPSESIFGIRLKKKPVRVKKVSNREAKLIFRDAEDPYRKDPLAMMVYMDLARKRDKDNAAKCTYVKARNRNKNIKRHNR